MAGLAAHLRHRLPVHQLAKTRRHPGRIHKVVADIDEQLKGQRKLVLHQPRGDKYVVRAGKVHIAMANRAIAQLRRVLRRNQRLAARVRIVRNVVAVLLMNGKRHKIIGAMLQRSRHRAWHSPDHLLQLARRQLVVAKGRVADAVFRLHDRRLPRHVGGR